MTSQDPFQSYDCKEPYHVPTKVNESCTVSRNRQNSVSLVVLKKKGSSKL